MQKQNGMKTEYQHFVLSNPVLIFLEVCGGSLLLCCEKNSEGKLCSALPVVSFCVVGTWEPSALCCG